MINLYDLNINACAEIISINNKHAGKIRLLEMGLMPSTEARMIKKAPFGGPIQIKINNYYITLRKEDAVDIIVQEVSK